MTARSLRQVTLALMVALLGLMLLAAEPARAQASDDAVIVSADDGTPISAGGGDTEFSLLLPEGAACPGDSEQGEYRVQSFLVPSTVDPGALQYKGLRPQTEGGWALYELNTTTYMNRPTAKAVEPGGEGTIINIPGFSFAVFDPGMLPVGRARIGISCSLYSETERYWATEIDVVADEDDPAGIAWTVVDPPAGADDGSGSRSAVWTGLAGVALVVALLVWGLRRRSGIANRMVTTET